MTLLANVEIMRILRKSSINFKMISDYLTVFIGSGFGRGVSLLLSIIIARNIGSEDFGRFSLFFAIMMLVWELANVTDMTYVRFVKTEEKFGAEIYIRASISIKLTAIAALIILSYPIASFVSSFIFNKPETFQILLIAFFSGGFLSLFYGVAAIYQAQEDFKLYSLANSAYYVLVLISVAILWTLNLPFDAERIEIAYLLPAVVLGIIGILILLKKVAFSLKGCKPALSGMVNFGKWLLAENLIYLSLQRIDLLFLTRYSDFSEIGIYSAAIRVAMIASLFTSSLSFILMPKGCESIKSRSQVKQYLKESFYAVFIISCIIVIIILACPYLISIFFGIAYVGAIIPARILLVEAIIVVIYTPFSFLFYAVGSSKKIFYVRIVKLVFAIILLFLLTDKLGSIGAALSIALSSLAGLFYTLFIVNELFKKLAERPLST